MGTGSRRVIVRSMWLLNGLADFGSQIFIHDNVSIIYLHKWSGNRQQRSVKIQAFHHHYEQEQRPCLDGMATVVNQASGILCGLERKILIQRGARSVSTMVGP